MATVYGFDLPDLEPDEYPMGAVLILKYMDGNGMPGIWHQLAEVTPHEAIGMALSFSDQLRADLMVHGDGSED